MKIAYLVNNICQVGGIERVICHLSTYFSEYYGYDVEIHSLCSYDKQNVYFPLSKKVKIIHYNIDYKSVSRSGEVRLVRDTMAKMQADILITSHSSISIAAILSRRVFKGKLIITEHNAHNNYTQQRLFLNQLFYRFADQLVLLTEFDSDFYKSRGVKKCCVIPNAVSVNVSDKSFIKQECFVSTGRLEEVKGYDLLISAFAKIHSQIPSWKLKILGDGTMRNQLESQINKAGLQDSVMLPGFVKDIEAELKTSSIFVMSSRFEGFSLALIEALKCDLPCISFALPPAIEILKDDIGVLVSCNDVDELANAMVEMAQSAEKREYFSIKAKKRSEDFSLSQICAIWQNLFQKL